MQEYTSPQAMKRLGDLFEKYKHRFKAPQSSVEKESIVVIKELTGYELSTEQVSYTVSTRTISLQIPSLLKTEVLLRQGDILRELEKRLGPTEAPKLLR